MDFISTLTKPYLCSKDFFDNLLIERTIGVGAFGEALLSHDPSGNYYIIKRLNIRILLSTNPNAHMVRNEIINHFAITQAKCSYVCPIICVQYSGDFLDIIMKQCGTTLSEIIDSEDISNEQALKWTEQLLLAIRCIHQLDIVHFDINPGNILIDENDDIRIIDFGLSMHKSEYSVAKRIGGTTGYILHESIRRKTYDFRNDSYAVGEVLKALWSCDRPTPINIRILYYNLTGKYEDIINMEQALHILNPEEYPNEPMSITLDSFNRNVYDYMNEDVVCGVIGDTENDESILNTRKLVYSYFTYNGFVLFPEIVQEYPEVLEE